MENNYTKNILTIFQLDPPFTKLIRQAVVPNCLNCVSKKLSIALTQRAFDKSFTSLRTQDFS